ncbi:MAG: hypothetical protein K5657_07495 [Desulfovibrio sp.]|nr:hypothetical protein [Desulfovibrio sp.]
MLMRLNADEKRAKTKINADKPEDISVCGEDRNIEDKDGCIDNKENGHYGKIPFLPGGKRHWDSRV